MKKEPRGRTRFCVSLSEFRLVLVFSSFLNKSSLKIKMGDLSLNFAEFRVFSLNKWIQKQEKQDIYSDSSKLNFPYRTDYPFHLKDKQVEIRLTCNSLYFEGKINLLSLIYGGRISVDLFSTTISSLHKINFSFESQMVQECVIQLAIQNIESTSSLFLPCEVNQHPNSFWFSPEFSVQIWYISPERMTFLLQSSTKKKTWDLFRPCHINETTDVLKKSYLFIDFLYNDLPFAYSLIPFLKNYKVGLTSYQYILPLTYYYSNSKKSTLVIHFELQNGPMFWNNEIDDDLSSLPALDASQKKLLQSYFHLGFNREWIKKHLANLVESEASIESIG